MADWQDRLLKIMGAPQGGTNEQALTAWAESEGTPTDWNNWLATTENCCGGVSVNSAGVKQYPNEGSGINATWATLQGGAYSAVVSAFRGNKGLSAIWTAVNNSPWCGGCQNGLYPVVLYDLIKGSVHIPVPKNPPPAAPSPTPNLAATRASWDALGDFGTKTLPGWWHLVNGAGTSIDKVGR
jgi:hypothetical protein